MKELLKRNWDIIVSAFLAGAFFLFVCFNYEIFPFGKEYCLLFSDLAQQYGPMFTHLYDIIKQGGSILFSWSAGLGYSFLGNYLNYLASPFTYIILLFSRENIPHAISIIILLKSMMIAGCFSYYLKKSYSFKGAFNIIPSLLLTFSGWFVAYNWNIMWLDSIFCLPLAALGLQKIINERKPWLYLTVLSYSMFVNYYTAYMLCLFLVVYFIYYYLSNNEIKKDLNQGLLKSKLFKSGIMFVFFSILAALLCAVSLVSVFYALKSSSAVTDAFPNKPEFYFNPLYFLVQQFSGSSTIVQTTTLPDVPNCWSGLLTVVLIPVYFISKAFSKREKICDAFLLLFMFLSMNLNLLSFIWCGFHFANGIADRFAFFYIFVSVTIMAKALNRITEIKKSVIIGTSLACVVFIAVMRLLAESHTEKYAVIISLGFTAVWIAVFLLNGVKKIDRQLLKLIAVFVLCLELVFAQLSNFDFNYYKGDFDRDSLEFRGVYSTIKEKEDELFFRTEATDTQSYMYPMLMGYNGVTNFSSMSNSSVARSQYALGLDGNKENSMIYFSQTPVYNTVFGIKYLIGDRASFKYYDYYTKAADYDEFSAFKNNYYLPLGYCVDYAAEKYKTETDVNPLYQQNKLFSSFSKSENVFALYEPDNVMGKDLILEVKNDDSSKETKTYSTKLNKGKEKGFVEYSYHIPSDGEYYIYVSQNRNRKGTEIIVNGEKYEFLKYISNLYHDPNTILPIGNHKGGEKLTVRIPVTELTKDSVLSVYLASFNKDKFIEGYNKLSQHTLKLTEFENTHFKGEVTAGEDCLLFTSIPYDKGWHITLDGETVDKNDVIAVDDAYISIPLTKGEHTVEFNYFPQGLKAGACISAVTALGLIAYVIINRKKKKEI
ncbi:MAG: YfhO family protein [Clostridia bacterium]|nr:YfhO family protein [Clostridia bacterium]